MSDSRDIQIAVFATFDDAKLDCMEGSTKLSLAHCRALLAYAQEAIPNHETFLGVIAAARQKKSAKKAQKTQT